mgnify:CR=1 FL=1
MDETRHILAEMREGDIRRPAPESAEVGPQERLRIQVERAQRIRTFYMALVNEGFREPEALLLTGRLFN